LAYTAASDRAATAGFPLVCGISFCQSPGRIMKTPFFLGLLAVSLWLSPVLVSDAEVGTPEFDPLGEFNDLPKQIRVQVEFIEVAHEQLTGLMFGEKPAANDVELRKQLAGLVKDGRATILETMLCTSRSGQKATAEAIQEYIYPTEYEPASLPENVHVNKKEDAEAAKTVRRDLATGPTPTAFDTRNLGSTLEIEPTLSEDGHIIDLRFVPEIVYHVGNEIWAEWKGEHGNSPVQMPTMYALRINTAVTMAAGEPMLAAALSPKDAQGHPDFSRKLMIFVRADVLTVGR
jgi:Flp pilus assembly secretin CpaC